LAKSEPNLFLQRFKTPLIIDEIQYAPELLPFLKIHVDQNRTAGQYWLTDSQPFHLMQGVSESLAGRIAIINLLGFSQRELEGYDQESPFLPTKEILQHRSMAKKIDLLSVFHRIWLGSYPGLHQNIPMDRELFYSSYVQTYLQRDVSALANVGHLSDFLKFLRVCAARTGQVLNLQDFCRDCDIQHITVKRWLSILESSGIILLLPPFFSNLNQRLIKSPKLYFLDTGLACWLSKWSSPETLEAGAMAGAMLETWVISEILKSWWHHGMKVDLYYYRDRDGKEIDLLIERDGKIFPIEIKKSAHPTIDAIKHFKALETLKIEIAQGCVLCLADQQVPLNKEVEIVPIGLL
jgi:predicted AAA+ superfamily ATPase